MFDSSDGGRGSLPLVNTESAAVSTVVDEAYVKNMPLNGRAVSRI